MIEAHESTAQIRESFAGNDRVVFKQVTTRLEYAQIQVEIDGELVMFWDPKQPQVVQDVVVRINAVLELPTRRTTTQIIAQYFSDTPEVAIAYGEREDLAYVNQILVVSWPPREAHDQREEARSSYGMGKFTSTRRIIDTIKKALHPDRYMLTAAELATEQAKSEELLNTAEPEEADDSSDLESELPVSRAVLLLVVVLCVAVLCGLISWLMKRSSTAEHGQSAAAAEVVRLRAEASRYEAALEECEAGAVAFEAEVEESKRHWGELVLRAADSPDALCFGPDDRMRLSHVLRVYQIKADGFDEMSRTLGRSQ